MLTIKFCPQCGSEDIALVAGGIMGTFMCKNCGYNGIMPEKEVLGREIDVKKIDKVNSRGRRVSPVKSTK